jgi:hypothetical protein
LFSSRFEDPELGPRRIPNLEKPMEGKVKIGQGQIFKVDFDKKEVFLQTHNNGMIPIGERLIFRV